MGSASTDGVMVSDCGSTPGLLVGVPYAIYR